MKKKSAMNAIKRHSLFGSPPILEGEDVAAYDELLGRIYAAVKPADVIDEMLIDDIAALEWEVLRWRRLKSSLITARARTALQGFLCERLDYELYKKRFANDLAEILRANLAENRAEEVARTLARNCAEDEPGAVDKVNQILDGIGEHLDDILDCAQADKAEELAQQYSVRDPSAVKLINKLLAKAGVSIDTLMVKALAKDLDPIERIDRLTTIAENRRNASLREINRRRAALGGMLTRSVQEIEASELKVIDTTLTKGKDAA